MTYFSFPLCNCLHLYIICLLPFGETFVFYSNYALSCTISEEQIIFLDLDSEGTT